MAQIDVNINDYLSHDDIKEIITDQIKSNVNHWFKDEENTRRILLNSAYDLIFSEIDKTVPNAKDIIVDKTLDLINEKDFSFSVFRNGSYGSKQSLAYEIMEQTIRQNKDLINQKVKDTIENHDYSSEIWDKFEELAESYINNIYSIVELGRNRKEKQTEDTPF